MSVTICSCRIWVAGVIGAAGFILANPMMCHCSDAGLPCTEKLTHTAGKVALTVTNWGFLGSLPVFDEVAPPSCEYPKNSGIEYLYQGAIWVGGVVGDDTLVSVGVDGWHWVNEMYPPGCPEGKIIQRTTLHGRSVSDQDVYARFSDTLADPVYVSPDPIDGVHRPLPVDISQASFAWAEQDKEDFVLFDCVCRNPGVSTIENFWIGIFLDSDVWHRLTSEGFKDDLAGYLHEHNIAYVIDNDGDPAGTDWDSLHSPRAAIGLKLLRSEPPAERINFNWWTSYSDPRYDYGPRRAGTPADSYRDFGTGGYGTPEGDHNKYYMLSHEEVDYDQLWAGIDLTAEGWLFPDTTDFPARLADGCDTKILYSFGPYNLAPGDSIRFYYVMAMGDMVHVDPEDLSAYFDADHPQEFCDRLDFSDLLANISVAEALVENCLDVDDDGLCYDVDNCPRHANIGQEDIDADGVGDLCDNCPEMYNPEQEDLEGDGIGDSCEVNRTWSVKVDGTGDAPTIQAAIDLSYHGDTVLIGAGVYTGDGNRDLHLNGRFLIVKSEAGAEQTVIDCGGTVTENHRGFDLRQDGGDSTIVIDGLTIRGGYASVGGGMYSYASSVLMEGCVFHDNYAVSIGGGLCGYFAGLQLVDCSFIRNSTDAIGGGLACMGGEPGLGNCTFEGNSAGEYGGGLWCWLSEPTISRCSFARNTADAGGAIFGVGDFTPWPGANILATAVPEIAEADYAGPRASLSRQIRIHNCTLYGNSAIGGNGAAIALHDSMYVNLDNSIIAFSEAGSSISCSGVDSAGVISCCDIYGNAGGDWIGCIADWAGMNGNFAFDPQFNDTAGSNFSIKPESPCAQESNSCGVLIGAWEVCDCFGTGDCSNDGAITASDVAFLITYAFRGGTIPPADPYCPTVNRADVNCDGLVNLIDVVGLVNYVYRQPASGPCNPCAD